MWRASAFSGSVDLSRFTSGFQQAQQSKIGQVISSIITKKHSAVKLKWRTSKYDKASDWTNEKTSQTSKEIIEQSMYTLVVASDLTANISDFLTEKWSHTLKSKERRALKKFLDHL